MWMNPKQYLIYVYSDLEDLTKRTWRSADEHSKSIECYLKSDVEKRYIYVVHVCAWITHHSKFPHTWRVQCFCVRALEVWGSWQVLEHELNRRRLLAEEEERRRQGLGALIAQLKKYNKALGKTKQKRHRRVLTYHQETQEKKVMKLQHPQSY